MSERDKFLTEAMGECWHKSHSTIPYHDNTIIHVCKCGERGSLYDLFSSNEANYFHQDNNFSTWEGFGKLWNWSQKQPWWGVGLMGMDMYDGCIKIPLYIFNPDRFADAVYEYLKEEKCTL